MRVTSHMTDITPAGRQPEGLVAQLSVRSPRSASAASSRASAGPLGLDERTRATTASRLAPVVNAVNLPAMPLSGILLPMAPAPAWLDGLSRVVPFRCLVDAVRAAFVGDCATGAVGAGRRRPSRRPSSP